MLLSSLFLGFGLGDPETQIDEGLLLNIGRQRGKETAQCLRRGGRICPMLAGAAIVADLLSADDDLITLGSKAEEIIGAEAKKYTKRIRNRSVAALAENAINLSHKWSSLQNSFDKADSVFLAEQRTAIAGGVIEFTVEFVLVEDSDHDFILVGVVKGFNDRVPIQAEKLGDGGIDLQGKLKHGFSPPYSLF
jgi:hypothetical protein